MKFLLKDDRTGKSSDTTLRTWIVFFGRFLSDCFVDFIRFFSGFFKTSSDGYYSMVDCILWCSRKSLFG